MDELTKKDLKKKDNKIKKTLVSSLVSLLAAGTIGLGTPAVSPAADQKLKPYGYVELAYVPHRTFFRKYENEFMAKLGFGLKLDLKKFSFDVNFDKTTYTNKSESIFFSPNTQAYNCSIDLTRKFGSRKLSLFFSHECVHPIDKEHFSLYDPKRKEFFCINYTDFTKIGIRFEF